MVDFNLPAVEVVLQEFFRGGFQIRAQQVGGIPVIDVRMSGHFVGDGSNHNQAEVPSCGTAPPEDVIEDFVTNFTALGAKADAGLLPIQAIRLADVVGSEDLGGVLTARAGKIGKTEPRIFAATGQQVDSRDRRFKEGAITETASAGISNCRSAAPF